MKKYVSLFLVLSLFFSCNIVSASENNQETPFVAEIVVRNYETKEVVDFNVVEENIFVTSNTKTRSSDGETYTAEYDAVLEFELDNPENQNSGIMPLSDISTNNDVHYVRANLKITYTVSSDQEEIKVSNVSGSWTGLMSGASMTFSNKEVNIFDGVPEVYGGKILTKYPSSSSFSYNTGWGYVTKYPSSSDMFTGARASSYTVASFNSMGGSAEIETLLVVP